MENNNPQKNNSQLQKIWDKEAESYSQKSAQNPDYLAHFQTVESVLINVKNKKILEVGSGTAITSAYLAQKGAYVSLVDLSSKALSFAQKYFQRHYLKVNLFNQDAFKMKFVNNSFDVVWSGGLIEHFDDFKKVKLIKKMWKLVKKGGILLIAVPSSSDWPFMVAKKILQWRNKWAFSYEDDLSKKRMEELAVKAGLIKYSIFSYNPIVGWWFFPYGKEITDLIGFNKTKYHKLKVPWGHNLIFWARKDF